MKQLTFLLFLLCPISAFAATFAHVESGQALDPQVNASEADYLKRYAAEVTNGWVVSSVPNGTLHGATPGAGGSWINPPVHQSASPVILNATDFAEFCYSTFGAVNLPQGTAQQQRLAGMARRGSMLLAAKNTTDPATFEAYTRFSQTTAYERDAVATFLAIIGPSPGSGITTQAENDAIIGGWPKQ